MAVFAAPIGVASHLAEVREPRVRAFDDPAEPERERLLGSRALRAPTLDADVIEPEAGELGADLREVVAAVEAIQPGSYVTITLPKPVRARRPYPPQLDC